MHVTINGTLAFAATGGKALARGQPAVVFVHGAGLDSAVWALHSRWFAYHGWQVLAVDLPGHGRSPGPPLESIGAMADWVVALVDATFGAPATLVGHSMGALVALEAAARTPSSVRALGLLGAAPTMPVHPDLLAAAKAGEHVALDMVNLWGHGADAALGGHQAPGFWMLGMGLRILERTPAGTLYRDLAACHSYDGGLAAASRVTCPTVVVCGERDQMTPLKGGRALASAIRGSRLVVLKGAGHMLLAERPDATREALVDAFASDGITASVAAG